MDTKLCHDLIHVQTARLTVMVSPNLRFASSEWAALHTICVGLQDVY